ncbi:NAD-dependent epimerase/dehydratase family protein [Pseudohoeflea coraliihabitans]|uniref:NAD(P)-dependent oxidoreductase n=1 Tax=Pseudohoeflea coraliihabitans TaxID=2860393 RepID=A0ABS6WMP7_9HYPH|nr:NAD(P)-dependent oxidoreductase [Pseudohoeflea sp. DP4N28-3]MBW3097223.1 NAD(P)-dependent oxidoreductase [Pseudohoeflea sp. DP4N28-3]
MGSRVLITGAAGLLGRYVVNECVANGYSVRGFDRQRGDAGIDWHIGDVTDPVAVRTAVEDMDAILHIAAVPNIWSGDGRTIMQVNVQGTYTVLEAAEAAGVGRFVFCSSDSVAGYTVREGRMLAPLYAPIDLDHPLQATDPYAISKILGEDLVRAYVLRGLSAVALRTVFIAYPEMAAEIEARAKDPHNYRGPAAGGPSSAGGGPLYHHIDPRDVARAFRLALQMSMPSPRYECFYLSSTVTLSPEPTLDRLQRLHGGTIEIRNRAVYENEPFAPLYDLTHAARGLGFTARYDQRHLITGDNRSEERAGRE